MKIGLLRETRVPVDKRVPLTPTHCVNVRVQFPEVQFACQTSRVRSISDKEYISVGIPVTEDPYDCDILLGVKEIHPDKLIPGKTYFFFSHTIKMQENSRPLLQSVVDKKVTLIDYECLRDRNGKRVVAFGHYAGIVGAYNTLRGFGIRYRLFDLKPAHLCADSREMAGYYTKIKLPPVKIVVTGGGRVAKGVMDTLDAVGIKQVGPDEMVTSSFGFPVYARLRSADYHLPKDSAKQFHEQDFYSYPENYEGNFKRFASSADILMASSYWNPLAPRLFSENDMQQPWFQLKMIGDITCDIHGSIPCTIRPSSIEDPFYDYNPVSAQTEPPFSSEKNITVMAVDNLPCELPRDASDDFGNQLVKNVIPYLVNGDSDKRLENATIVRNGRLMPQYEYLKPFIQSI